MSERQSGNTADKALLIAVAVALVGYLPATATYGLVMGWISPMRHPEEAMGRGLEAIFIGGPIGTLCLAVATGWLVYRSKDPPATRFAIAAVGGLALVSVAILRWENLL